MLDDPSQTVRQEEFSVAPMRKGFLLRNKKWAYIQYGEKAQSGIELFDMKKDSQQFHNLAKIEKYTSIVQIFHEKLVKKLAVIRNNDL